MTDLSVLGIIPARSGSKGIANKNIRKLAEKPLLAYSIESALQSKAITRLIVSTDSESIADMARGYGAETPFLRPAEISQDDTPGIEPVLHAIKWLAGQGYQADYVMLLQPTSPLRAAIDIQSVISLALEKNADCVVSVTEAKEHPFWMKQIQKDGTMSDFFPQKTEYFRRQDLPQTYSLNGAIYLARPATLISQRSFFTSQTYAYVMPAERSIDIDTPWDLHVADLILRNKLEQ